MEWNSGKGQIPAANVCFNSVLNKKTESEWNIHLYFTELGGRVTDQEWAVRSSSPLTASVIRFWNILLKTASHISGGTCSGCDGLCVPSASSLSAPSVRTWGSGEDEEVERGSDVEDTCWYGRILEAKGTRDWTKAASSSTSLKTERQ